MIRSIGSAIRERWRRTPQVLRWLGVVAVVALVLAPLLRLGWSRSIVRPDVPFATYDVLVYVYGEEHPPTGVSTADRRGVQVFVRGKPLAGRQLAVSSYPFGASVHVTCIGPLGTGPETETFGLVLRSSIEVIRGLAQISPGRRVGSGPMHFRGEWGVTWCAAADHPTVQGGPVLSVAMAVTRGDWPLSVVHCLYRTTPAGAVQPLLRGDYSTWAGSTVPGLHVVPSPGSEDGMPAVIAFQPPLGLVRWDWRDGAYRAGLPRLGDAPIALGLLVQGYSIWLVLAPGLVALFLLVRHYARTWEDAVWWHFCLGVIGFSFLCLLTLFALTLVVSTYEGATLVVP